MGWIWRPRRKKGQAGESRGELLQREGRRGRSHGIPSLRIVNGNLKKRERRLDARVKRTFGGGIPRIEISGGYNEKGRAAPDWGVAYIISLLSPQKAGE